MKKVFVIILIITSYSCTKRISPTSPSSGQFKEIPAIEESVIEIPISIDFYELNQFVNTLVPSEIYSGNQSGRERARFSQGFINVSKDWEWDADLRIIRNGDIFFDVFSDGSLNFLVPLQINCHACASVQLGTHIRKCGNSSSALELYIRTSITFNEDWSVSSQTTIEHSFNNPTLSIPFSIWPFPTFNINLNLRNALQNPVDNELEKYARQVDELIGEYFNSLNIRDIAMKAWDEMGKSHRLSNNPTTYININPKRVFVSNLSKLNNKVSINLGAVAYIELSSQPELFQPKPFPNLEIAEYDGNVNLNIPITVDFKTLENIIKENVQDSTFTHNDYSVTIKDVSVYGIGSALVIDITLDGRINSLFRKVSGHVYMLAQPAYDKENNVLYLQRVELTSETNRMLIDRNITWLSSRYFYQQIIDRSRINLSDEISKIEGVVNSHLHNLAYDFISVNGSISTIELQDFLIAQNHITLFLKGIGSLQVEVLAW